MKELNKEQYFRILHDCKRVCNNKGFSKTETINQIKDLRIDAFRARKHCTDMVNFNNHVQNVLMLQLFNTPWIDSNLDIDKTIDRINKHQHLAIRWALDASIVQKTIELCDKAIAFEYDRYATIKDAMNKIFGKGFSIINTDYLTGMGDDNFITRLVTQGKLEFNDNAKGGDEEC